jgi:hypothetical protein
MVIFFLLEKYLVSKLFKYHYIIHQEALYSKYLKFGHVDEKWHTDFWSENLKRRDHTGEPRHKWEDINESHREIEWEGVYWMHLAQDRDRL